MAPQSFNTVANIDKMKQFILKFVDSDTVQKEVDGGVENFKKWLNIFSMPDIPANACTELMGMVEVAEDRSKIALIDLVRLLFQYEAPTGHIIYKHWESLDTIFQYIKCLDIKNPDEKVTHNIHLVCLKMLGNLY